MVNKGLLNFKDKVDLSIPQIKIIDKVFSKEFDRAFLRYSTKRFRTKI